MLLHRSRSCFFLSAVAVALVLAALPACAQSKQTAFMKSSGKIITTAEELRSRMRNQAGIFSNSIEETADVIMQTTEDEEIYNAALLWKSRAIPAVFQAAFRPDPLMALMDTWAFSIQMRLLASREEMAEQFGEVQPLLLETALRLEAGMESVALTAAVENDVSIAKEKLEEWALENPIRSRTFSRTAITQHLQDEAVTKRKGGLASMGALTVDLADLVARVGLYMEHMPKQVAWEAELILNEHLPDDEIDTFLYKVPEALEGLDDTAAILGDLPDLIAQERAIVLDAVSEERRAVMENVDQDLDLIFQVIARERMAAFADLRVEREAAQEELQRQRIATLDAIREERELAFEEVEAMAGRIVDQAADRLEASLDRVLLKVGLFMGVALVLITLAGLIILRSRHPAGVAG
jgi:hypothetical protein